MAKGTELAITQTDIELAQQLDTSVQDQRKEIDKYKEHPALRMIATASALRVLRDLMTPELIERHILPLQNTSLGFMTDRKEGYSAKELRDPMIEAMLMGLSPVNQEIAIIAGRCYAAKNGLLRKVQEATTNLQITPGVPQACPNGALIGMSATWERNGKPESLHCQKRKDIDGNEMDERIAVRVNAGMGADAIIGKAVRKLCRRILDKLGYAAVPIADGDPDEFQAAPQNNRGAVDVPPPSLTASADPPRPHGQEGMFPVDE
jgi:hypothetical protein